MEFADSNLEDELKSHPIRGKIIFVAIAVQKNSFKLIENARPKIIRDSIKKGIKYMSRSKDMNDTILNRIMSNLRDFKNVVKTIGIEETAWSKLVREGTGASKTPEKPKAGKVLKEKFGLEGERSKTPPATSTSRMAQTPAAVPLKQQVVQVESRERTPQQLHSPREEKLTDEERRLMSIIREHAEVESISK